MTRIPPPDGGRIGHVLPPYRSNAFPRCELR